jgi:hypothetical protein
VWTVRTVAAILANPRYTGRQVWNRQRTDHHESMPGDKRTSTGKTRAWNPKADWVVSQRTAHPALVRRATCPSGTKPLNWNLENLILG